MVPWKSAIFRLKRRKKYWPSLALLTSLSAASHPSEEVWGPHREPLPPGNLFTDLLQHLYVTKMDKEGLKKTSKDSYIVPPLEVLLVVE